MEKHLPVLKGITSWGTVSHNDQCRNTSWWMATLKRYFAKTVSLFFNANYQP